MTKGLHTSPPIQFYRTDILIFFRIKKCIEPSTKVQPIDANTNQWRNGEAINNIINKKLHITKGEISAPGVSLVDHPGGHLNVTHIRKEIV